MVAEMLIGTSLFPGASNVDQMVEIIKVLGTPTREEVLRMNPDYHSFNFSSIQKRDLKEVLSLCHDEMAIDLMRRLLVFVPENRLTGEDGK